MDYSLASKENQALPLQCRHCPCFSCSRGSLQQPSTSEKELCHQLPLLGVFPFSHSFIKSYLPFVYCVSKPGLGFWGNSFLGTGSLVNPDSLKHHHVFSRTNQVFFPFYFSTFRCPRNLKQSWFPCPSPPLHLNEDTFPEKKVLCGLFTMGLAKQGAWNDFSEPHLSDTAEPLQQVFLVFHGVVCRTTLCAETSPVSVTQAVPQLC